MTTPANIPIAILQGSTFEDFLEYTEEDGTPIDLTGCKARMQIRTEIDSDEVQADLTTENEGLQIFGPEGKIRRFISDTDTQGFQFPAGVYDLEIVWPDTHVMRLVEGTVSVSFNVTR